MKSIFDPGVLALQKTIVYGPVISRRLGYSLGVNILSPDCKICSFDCVYCQYGKTHIKTRNPDKLSVYTTSQILKEVEKSLLTVRKIDSITLSGNGEPTIHPEFHQIVIGIKTLRDRLRPDVKISLFSNATELVKEEVKSGLLLIDMPILKLDATNQRKFDEINKPVENLQLTEIVMGLKEIKHFVMQSIFITGKFSNISDQSVDEWIDLLLKIKPASVQVYSTDRASPEEGLEIVPPYKLKEIAELAGSKTGILVQAYWPK
jgi:wyosine [tRNA(Phe)-imidazoG37] synthetase (radical SAM superfamily)